MGEPVECVEKKSYAEINALLRSGDVDMAFVCSKPYVDGHAEFGLELLVAPQVRGKAEYYSYIIVPGDSRATGLPDLRGRSFGFTDPMSNTGKLAPAHALSLLHETPDTFFKEYIYTYAHDWTIRLVAGKVVDGGSVDSLVWEYGHDVPSDDSHRTKIIERLGPFGIPPVVVRKELASSLKHKLRDILLDAHKDGDAARILAGMMVDRFVVANDAAYDSIREMEAAMIDELDKRK